MISRSKLQWVSSRTHSWSTTVVYVDIVASCRRKWFWDAKIQWASPRTRASSDALLFMDSEEWCRGCGRWTSHIWLNSFINSWPSTFFYFCTLQIDCMSLGACTHVCKMCMLVQVSVWMQTYNNACLPVYALVCVNTYVCEGEGMYEWLIVRMCVCIYARIHVRRYLCMNLVFACVHACMYVCMYVYMYVCDLWIL